MKKVGVYIHIPFCKAKCLYCDFCSFAGREDIYKAYTDVLIEEIKHGIPDGCEIGSIFIGGGTPTVLPPDHLQRILEAAFSHAVALDAEVTVESNPGTLNRDMLRLLRESGVNRLSMGLQSTDNTLLERIGRIHSFEECASNIEDARSFGFDNINLDIMFSLPGQSIESLAETLVKVTALEPEHISAYSLIIEEGTPMACLYNEGKLALPDDEEDRNMYAYIKEYLTSNNYSHYEISNFAKLGCDCKHNTLYWLRRDYLGFGLAAHSFFNGVRYQNTDNPELYLQSNGDKRGIKLGHIVIEEREAMEEFMFLGLRMICGVDERDFSQQFHKPIDQVFGESLKFCLTEGLITRRKGRIALTSRGIDISNRVFAEFLK